MAILAEIMESCETTVNRGFMSDIFISYAREDLERVKPIVEELEKNGWSVFWDRNLRPGSRWAIEITKALDESRCVLVVWSSASINAEKHHWVREEAETGRERGILVPLRLDDVVLPLGFRSIHAADLLNWNKNSDDPQFQQLIDAITDIIPPPQKTASSSSTISAVPSAPRAMSVPVERVPAARQQSAALKTLAIGEKYGGGKVAFLDATGQHGLIAAEADLPGGAKYSWDAAKKACSDLRENGYSDWYLPSKEELNQFYLNRCAVGGFAPDYYWSSTADTLYTALDRNFDNGSQSGSGKLVKWRVRPVRAF
jgi:hypothetical protein